MKKPFEIIENWTIYDMQSFLKANEGKELSEERREILNAIKEHLKATGLKRIKSDQVTF